MSNGTPGSNTNNMWRPFQTLFGGEYQAAASQENPSHMEDTLCPIDWIIRPFDAEVDPTSSGLMIQPSHIVVLCMPGDRGSSMLARP